MIERRVQTGWRMVDEAERRHELWMVVCVMRRMIRDGWRVDAGTERV